jgi:light-regulated signal transduction histidine kinase (bacteriophytochrome)
VPELRLNPLPPAMGDRALLAQVWINLLSNAIKFSAKREQPLIEVGAKTDDHEHVYSVSDNGAGFDPRYASKLFGVFQRLHDQSEFQGTGVGLALVQRIITRHGGRVWAESTPGAGATFHFTLPRSEADGRV